LVAHQLRVAAGEPLGFTQDDVEVLGHAIEIRINAEDPAQGAFLPSPGPIETLRAPGGFGVRWDGGYEAGDEISQYYDNLVGKLICWGKDRPTAIARTIRALEELEVTGVATTIPADLAILRHDDFATMTHSTKWVEDTLDLSGVIADTTGSGSGDDEPTQRRDVQVEVNGKRFAVSMWLPESDLGPQPAAAAARPARRKGASGGTGGGGSGEVTVPMQGTVVKVVVEVGQQVEAGDTVIVLEAMKMENNVVAERAGTVTEVRVEAGQSIGGGEVVAVIE
jgi:acetyl-CoA/propionyl-CoA carboxylase biotin carboxyl carrier protein